MNKKQLIELMESMVARAARDQGISEDEARCLIGLSIKKNCEKILAGVILPSFAAPTTELVAA